MHFEGPIWKYLKAYPLGPWEKKNGATCIFLPDPFYIKFFLEIKPENGIRFLRPENVTLEFFINEFENPGLFPCEETLVITEAQDLTSEAKEILLQKNWDFSTKGLILFFNKKVSQ